MLERGDAPRARPRPPAPVGGGSGVSYAPAPRPLYAMSRLHLAAMSDGIGLWQHARGSQPDPRFGYCTDDVARNLAVDVLHARAGVSPAVEASVSRSLTFLVDAFDRPSGRFRNFRGADGGWLDAGGSEDSHARALVGLAAVMAEMPGTEPADRAGRLFERALPAARGFGALRAISAAILACDSACEAGLSSAVMPTYELLADRLKEAFEAVAESVSVREMDRFEIPCDPVPGGRPGGPAERSEWLWPEPVLTYENALMPHALIVAGERLGRPAPLAIGCAVLDWLIEVQAGDGGVFSPVGNSRWWPRRGRRSRFDQQPIEAEAMVSAALAAFRVTGRWCYPAAAETAYGWFLGDNDLGVALADPVSGSCFDGLTPAGVNRNQGAESTLMWLIALERMRELRGGHIAPEPVMAAEPGDGRSLWP